LQFRDEIIFDEFRKIFKVDFCQHYTDNELPSLSIKCCQISEIGLTVDDLLILLIEIANN
jgi:hypothetical protein